MITDWFSFWANIVPHKSAITTCDDGRSYTYHDINKRANAIAGHLVSTYNLKKGNRISILSQNSISLIYLFAVAQKIGVILVPLNYRLTKFELDQLVQDCRPDLLIYEEQFKLETDQCPSMSMTDLESIGSDEVMLKNEIQKEDPIFILYTSGSTGIPKGVLYTYKMLFWNSVNTSVSLGVNNESTALVCMPPFHTGGWNVLLTPTLHHGGHVIITKKFEAKEILIALEKYECDQFMAVPTMLKMMRDEALFLKGNFVRLPYIIVGGEAMPLDLIEDYEARGISIRQGFGMTEVGPNLTSLHQSMSKEKIGSIGKPNMYVKVKLVDEKDNEVEVGSLGELCFSGPVVTPGYWKNPEGTKYSIKNNWFYSGDIAMMDKDGYLYIKDRKKNMYISGGENVYPAEIERVLRTHPDISNAVVVGVPDDKWGEVGKVFIEFKKQVSDSDLKTFCLERLSKFKIPKYFVSIDTIPLNSSGKIDRKILMNT